jgi:hypothetical protein
MPFQIHQAAPLQSLLSVAASIPGVLERVDVISLDPSNAASRAASQRIKELTESITHLKAWYISFLESSSAPLYWRQTIERNLEGSFESLWYHNLSTANVFIYFWAFHLICLVEIRSLQGRFPTLDHSELNEAPHGTDALREECLKLSTQIYQSMEFVLQPDFMLYGISSAGFPLQTACETLQSDVKGRIVLDKLDPSVVIRSQIRVV